MHILLFECCGGLGDAGRFLVDLARGLLARAWEVAVVLGEEERLGEELRRLGVAVTVIPLPSWASGGQVTPWNPGLLAISRLAGVLRQTGRPFLYANGAVSALMGAVAARLTGGQACWRAQTTNEASQVTARLARRLGARLLPSAPAIDLDRLRPLGPPRRSRGEAPVVGMLAPWLPRSGTESLLRAFGLLHAAGRQGRLRLGGIGRGDERLLAMLRSTAQAQRWAEYVSFDEDVTDPATFLADCDLLAIPALEEDTGRAALEAAAMGRPTVATRVSGLETLIADGHTGLLVPPGDPRAFADALELLLASPALRAEMGRQARVRAEERYGIGTVVDALEAALPTTTRSRVGR